MTAMSSLGVDWLRHVQWKTGAERAGAIGHARISGECGGGRAAAFRGVHAGLLSERAHDLLDRGGLHEELADLHLQIR